MIAVDNVDKRTIRRHYQLGTPFYRLLWGPHIHHGLWSGDESARDAADRLTDTLADLAEIDAPDCVLDVGCGMGESAIRLARQRGCDVTGITISPLQRHWATITSRLKRTSGQTRFVAGDAEAMEFADKSFDVVWSVECTEHLFDKPAFFQHVGRLLRPGGRLAICVWFAGDDDSNPEHRAQVEEVCHRFVCPSLGSRRDYADWIKAAGLRVTTDVDWTQQTMRTWQICKRRVARTGVRYLANLLDRDQVAFLDGFDTLLNAYQSGAMNYGAMIAEKPHES